MILSRGGGRGSSEPGIRQEFIQGRVGLPVLARHERMFDNHRLLLNPIAAERSAGFDPVVVAAEGMAAQEQAKALLVLPDMRQFMDEEGLKALWRVREIGAPHSAVGMEPDMAIGCHGDVARLEGKPFCTMDTDRVEVERLAEDTRRKPALARRKRSSGIAVEPDQ